MTKTEKMFALVEAWKTSGKTQKIFCQEHDLTLPKLAYWIAKKKRTEEPSAGFVPIDVGGELNHLVELIYPNRVKLLVSHPDLGLIGKLIRLY